jgi:hypothetical protein
LSFPEPARSMKTNPIRSAAATPAITIPRPIVIPGLCTGTILGGMARDVKYAST